MMPPQWFKSEKAAALYFHAFCDLSRREIYGVDCDGIRGRLYLSKRARGGFWAQLGA